MIPKEYVKKYKMNREELRYWLDRYNKEEDLYNTGLEEEIGEIIRLNKRVTKKDLKKIIGWKFQGRLKGRKKRTFNLIKHIEDSEIQRITEAALCCDSDEAKLRLLMLIKGVGIALASVILTFFNPKKYCIFDIHVYDELFHTNAKTRPRNLFTNRKHFMKILHKVTYLAEKSGLRVRDVEKALFKKNLEESKSSNAV